MKNITQKEFEEKLKEKNKNFNVSFTLIDKFINCRTKIKVLTKYGVCLTNPYSLLDGNSPSIQTAMNKSDYFINQANEIHRNRYSYENVKYQLSNVKVTITCKKHGNFTQKPNCHLNGAGCPKCNTGGWDFDNWLDCKGKIGTFYILECFNENEEFIKFGITTESVTKRYQKKDSMPYKYKILHETSSTNKEMILEMERRFLLKFKKHKYLPKIDFGGKTECFNKSILKNIKL